MFVAFVFPSSSLLRRFLLSPKRVDFEDHVTAGEENELLCTIRSVWVFLRKFFVIARSSLSGACEIRLLLGVFTTSLSVFQPRMSELSEPGTPPSLYIII